MIPNTPCDEKTRLLLEYQRLNREYSAALAKFAFTSASQPEGARLRIALADAHVASVEARKKLDDHAAEHG